MKNWIAQRELLYSLNDSDIRQKLTIRVSEPYLVKEGMVDFKFPEGMSGCTVEFIGLNDDYVFEGTNTQEIYGADSLQALELSVNIDPALKRLSKKYSIYFPCGDTYFEPTENQE